MPFQVGSTTVLHQPAASPAAPDARYAGLAPSSTILPKCHQKAPENRPLGADIIYERDIQVQLRDGVKLRADIFRPNALGQVPVLMAWSPYGKTGTGFLDLHLFPGRVGIPPSMVSGYQSFEGPDPAEWVGKGYAIMNVDARGVFDSEGDVRFMGTAEARDGYDVIEEIAKLQWCNGKVALVGNSWLAMIQWHIASLNPPHLACIAPLEGASDFYRETLSRGGVPSLGFAKFISSKIFGRNQVESVPRMLAQYPYMNEYWADKRARIEDIKVPAYILASYSTGLHTVGSFRGFEDIKHRNKWLRVHATQEWFDLYQKETNDDLQLFFDRYTKGIENGWENTPSVRVSMLQFNQDPIVNHVFPNWPVPNTTYTPLYLSSSSELSRRKSTISGSFSYQADVPALQMDNDAGELKFTYIFTKKAYLVGYPKAILYMSCPSHNDLDVYVQLRKATASEALLQNLNIPLRSLDIGSADQVARVNPNFYLGPTGVLRASRRAIDPKLSKPHWAVHAHTQESEKFVVPGEVVDMEIGIWPIGMTFEEGEKLVLKISGHQMVLAEFEMLRGAFQVQNKGKHIVHVGGEYESRVVVPFVEL